MSASLQRNDAIAGLVVLAAQLSINIGAALGKGLFAEVGPEGVAALRTSIAALVLLAIARPWREPLTRPQMKWLGLYGLALGGMNLLFYWGLQRIPIGIAVTIEVCGPLAIVLISSRTLKDLLWLALAASGLLLLMPRSASGAHLDPLGVFFVIGAAACWALYILFGKQASQVRGVRAVAIGMAVACLLTVPVGVSKAGVALLAPHAVGLGLVVALLSSALPYFMEMKALERLSSRVFGLVISAAPAIAAVIGVVLLGERLAVVQWGAVALMVAASAGASISARPNLPDEDPATVDL